MPCDGTFPTATTQYEKRSIAQDIPIWDPKICTQCGLCSLGCPHATIRMKAFDPALLAKAPAGFRTADYKGKEFPGWKFVVQVAPDDCTGCGLCVEVCPAKDKEQVKHRAIDMEPKLAAPGRRAGELRLLHVAPRRGPREGQAGHDQRLATAAAAVRVLRGLRRLRRNALRQAADPVLRRPDVDRQRHRLLVDLRRQSALHALLPRRPGPRTGLVQFALRGRRRVRLRLPPGHRPAGEIRPRAAPAALRPVGRRTGRRAGEQQAGDRGGDRRPAAPRGRVEQAAGRRSTRRTPRPCWPRPTT